MSLSRFRHLTSSKKRHTQSLSLLGSVPPYFNQTENKIKQAVLACTVMAHWVPASPVRVSLNESEFIEELRQYNSPDDVVEGTAKRIKITAGWLPFLNRVMGAEMENPHETGRTHTRIDKLVNLGMKNTSFGDGPGAGNSGPGLDFDKIGDFEPTEDFGLFSSRALFEKVFSGVFVDGLARMQSHGHSQLTIASNETATVMTHLDVQSGPLAGNMVVDWSSGRGVTRLGEHMEFYDFTWERVESYLKFPLEAQKYGYGFGKPTEGMKFALGVMLT